MAKSQASPTWQPELKRIWSSTCSGPVTSIALSSKGKVAVSTSSSIHIFDPPPSLALKQEISGGPAAMMPRPMAVPLWMYPPQATTGPWGMAAYPQHWAAPYYGYYPPAAFQHPGMAQHPGGMVPHPAANPLGQPGADGPGGSVMGHGHASSGSLPTDSDSRQDGPGAGGNAPYASGRGGGSDGAGEDIRHHYGGAPGGDTGLTGNRALYVGNLAPTVDEQALSMHFTPFGQVLQAQVMRDRETGNSRGYGFVTFASSTAAHQAMQQLHGASLPGPFQGRPLRVSPSNKAK
eukprot:gene8179-8370_t